MARVELGESRIRARRRRRRLWLAGSAAIFIVLLVGGSVWLSRAPFLRVTSIEVSGTQTLSTSTVVALVQQDISGNYWHLFAKNNIFLYPKNAIAEQLVNTLPVIASASVHAQDFHTISIDILERQPKALWCGPMVASSTSCLLLDQDGVAYAPSPITGDAYEQYYGALIASTTPPHYLGAGQFRALTALVDALAQSQPNDSIHSVYVDENNDVHATFASGFELLFALSNAGGDVYQRFELALQSGAFKGHQLSDFEYLDLRFGDKLYYKLK